MIALLTSLALAGTCPEPGPDPLVDALQTELTRSLTELSLPDAPPLYHLRYHIIFMEQVDIQASLGFLVERSTDPYSALAVEVRVGEPGFDNTGFGGWENGFDMTWMPDRPTPRAVALAAWRLTDGAYKQAVEQHARKSAQFTAPPDYPGDYSLTGPVRADCGPGAGGDVSALEARARAISAVFAQAGRPVEIGRVDVGHESGSHWILDSEGTRVRQPRAETSLRATLHLRTDDGMLLTDQILWSVRRPDDLPPVAEMVAQATQMRDHLVALADRPILTEEYVGPVVLEDEAAMELMRELLVPQLEGTPPEQPFESFLGDLSLSGSTGEARLSRRVLPLGWEVTDDPTRDPRHPGSYRYDDEGTPARGVELVSDGIVRTVLMSRVPRKDVPTGTNGHARGALGERLNGRVSSLEIRPDRELSARKLHKKAVRLAASYGRDWYIAVRRIQEPATRMLAGYGARHPEGTLPFPVALVKVYADGHEEELRGGAFGSVQRFALRDIVAAGPKVEGTFMIPGSPGDGLYSPTEGMPTWMRTSDLLIGELELVPTHGDPKSVPVIPPPIASR